MTNPHTNQPTVLRVLNRVFLGVLISLLAMATPIFGQQQKTLQDGIRALYRGEYPGAAQIGRNLARARPAAAAPRVLVARAEMAQENFQAAFEELRKALRSDPNHQEALYYLGQLCTILSQKEYQQLFAMAPDSARVHQILAESYRAQENTAKAEEEYLAALKADPNLIEVLNVLGDFKRHQFRFEEAVGYYSRAAKLNPRDYDSAYGLGASQLYLQKPEEAVESFRRALGINPKAEAAHLAMGDALLRLNDAEGAVSHLKEAVAIEPKLRQAYTLMGRAYQKLGKSEEARQAFKLSQELIEQELDQKRSVLETKEMVPAQKAR
jgi:Tfp pilus assembly protein PilF